MEDWLYSSALRIMEEEMRMTEDEDETVEVERVEQILLTIPILSLIYGASEKIQGR